VAGRWTRPAHSMACYKCEEEVFGERRWFRAHERGDKPPEVVGCRRMMLGVAKETKGSTGSTRSSGSRLKPTRTSARSKETKMKGTCILEKDSYF